jgi:hypothetical protein
MDLDLVDATIRIHRNMGQLTGGRPVTASTWSASLVLDLLMPLGDRVEDSQQDG